MSLVLDMAQPVEWAHPLNAGRVAWWLTPPGQGSGALLYNLTRRGETQAAVGCHGSLVNAAWAPGPGGFPGVSFTGSQYVTVGTFLPALDFGFTPYSFGGWVTVASGYTSSGSFPFCRRSPTTSGNPGYEFLYGGSNSMAVRANGGSVSWTTAVNDGVRRRFLCTVNPGGLTTLYVNGRPVASGSTGAASASQTDTATQFGARNSTPGFQGGVGDFSVWGRLLSPADAAADFDHASRGYTGPDTPLRVLTERAWSFGVIPRQYASSFGGSLAGTGAMLRADSRQAAGAIPGSGAARRAGGKSVAAGQSVTASGVKTPEKSGAGSAAASGSVSRSGSLGRPGVVAAAADYSRTVARVVAGSQAVSAAFSEVRSLLLGFASLLSPAGLIEFVKASLRPAGAVVFRPPEPERRGIGMFRRDVKKGAAERRLYVFDFRRYPEIEQGETLLEPVVTAAGLTTESVAVTATGQLVGPGDTVPAGKGVQVWISGGTAGSRYKLNCTASTSGGGVLAINGEILVT